MVATAIATAIFATPLHNFIIKNEKSYFPKYPARVLLFASLEFIPSLFFALFDASLAEPYRMGHIFLRGVLFFVAGFTASVFLTTILPYVAITPIRNLSIRKAMKLSRGYRWSIFAKLFGLSIIFTLFVVIVALLSVFTPWTLPSGDAGTSYYALKIAGGLVYSMMALLFVTLASLIYRRLSDVVETASSPASAEI